MSLPEGAELLATGAQLDGLHQDVLVVQAASAGVGAGTVPRFWDGAVTLQPGEGFIRATLDGDTFLTCPPRTSGVAESVNLLVQQDAVGGRSLALLGVAVAEGVAIEVTQDPHAVDMITLVWTGSQWLAFMGASNLLIPAGWVI